MTKMQKRTKDLYQKALNRLNDKDDKIVSSKGMRKLVKLAKLENSLEKEPNFKIVKERRRK